MRWPGPGVMSRVDGPVASSLSCPRALQGAAMMMENKPMSLKLIMTLAFSTLGERAFMNRTVGEIMWGYEDPLVHLVNKYLPNMFPFKGKFGLFAEVSAARRAVRGPGSCPRCHGLEDGSAACFSGWPGTWGHWVVKS